MDENGEVLFKITPATSKRIKPGAFYNFTLLANAFDLRKETEYKKLTGNGAVILEYGAQDMLEKSELTDPDYEIIKVHLESIDDAASSTFNALSSTISGIRIESVE
jgi:hypothetical protein